MLDRKIRYCSLPEAIREHFLWGARSIVIAGTHGKTTTTSLTGWLLTHGGARSDACSSAASPATSASDGSSYRLGQRPRLRHRRRRVRQRLLRQDREVPEVPARHRGRQQHRVRSRRHLRRPRRRDAGVPAAGRTWCRGTGCCCSAPTAPTRAALQRSGASRRSRRSASAERRRLAGATISKPPTARRASRCGTAARLFGAFELPLLGAHNVRNALAAIAVGAPTSASRRRRIADGLRAFARREAAARGRRRAPTASPSTTTSRIIRRRSPRRWPALRAGASRTRASGRSSSRAPPRRAGACSRTTSRARSRGADEMCSRRSSARRCRKTERLSVDQLVARSARGRALAPDTSTPIDDIVDTIVREHRDGRRRADHVERRLRRHPPEAAARAAARAALSDPSRARDSRPRMRITLFGDAALLVEFEPSASIAAVNARVLALGERCGRRARAGRARRRADVSLGRGLLRSAAHRRRRAARDASTRLAAAGAAACRGASRPPVEIPVCYGGGSGPDLAAVAAWAAARPHDVVAAAHARATYRVFMLGFVPGFRLPGHRRRAHRDAAPRHAAHRACRPARSASPARRPASIRSTAPAAGRSSAARRSACSIRARETAAPAQRRTTRCGSGRSRCRSSRRCAASGGAAMSLVVHRPGLLTTVQDLGRWGYQSRGRAVAGPMDPVRIGSRTRWSATPATPRPWRSR